MAARKFRHGTNFLLTALALFVILAVINIVSYNHFLRWDLTEKGEYTVSETTRNILGQLQNLVNINVYLSKKLPPELQLFERQLHDMLDEYATYGHGKLRIKYSDPGTSDPTARQLAHQLTLKGIRPQAIESRKRTAATQNLVYEALSVEYEGKYDVIPNLLDQMQGGGVGLTGDFEYLLTSRIFKTQRSSQKQTVGWLGDSKTKVDEDYAAIRNSLQAEWQVRDIRFDVAAPQIGADIAVLVVVNPRKMTPAQLFEIDQYLMRGGKLFALVERYQRDMNAGKAIRGLSAVPTNFNELLQSYGARVNEDQVIDPKYCAYAPSGRFLPLPYEFWPMIGPNRLNKDNPIVSNLANIVLPWTSSIDPVSSPPATVKYKALATTSDRSMVIAGQQISPAPLEPGQQPPSSVKSRTVIAELSGIFPSHFAKGTPYPVEADTTATRSATRTPEAERLYESPETHIVVVGNSMFIDNLFLQATYRMNHNPQLFMNTVEWLALGKGLSQIRGRTFTARLIDSNMSEQKKRNWQIVGTFAMPLFVVAFGFVFNFVRRHRRRVQALMLVKRRS